jgi:hypothetical protein
VPVALLIAVAVAVAASAGLALATSGSSTPAAPAKGTLKLAASPSSVTATPGATATYTVKITSKNLSSAVQMSVSGLPSGAAATFSPNPASGTSTTLTVTTDADATPDGKRTLTITGTANGVSASETVALDVVTPADFPFKIAGSVSGLAPNVTKPLDLMLSNRSGSDLWVFSLTTAIGAVNAPNATPALPCTAADFSIHQYSGLLPLLLLPARSSTSLSARGLAQATWPSVTMLNRPVNQNGCKGATLMFSYGGTAVNLSALDDD